MTCPTGRCTEGILFRRTTSPNKSSHLVRIAVARPVRIAVARPVRIVVARPVRAVVVRLVRTNQAIDRRVGIKNAEDAETDFVGRGQWYADKRAIRAGLPLFAHLE